jgi:hypothetical protein
MRRFGQEAVMPRRVAFIQARVTIMAQASAVPGVAGARRSLFWVGIVFGIGRIVYMAIFWIQICLAGGVAGSTPNPGECGSDFARATNIRSSG